MTPKAWRALLLSLCAVLFACVLYELWAFTTIMGVSGATITRTHDLIYRIEAPKYSEAYGAGLRTGDLINAATMSSQRRYRLNAGVWAVGERVPLTAQRGSRTVHVVLRPRLVHVDWYGWVFTLGGFWMLLFAAVIAWKAPASAAARVLCLWLIVFQTVSLASNNWWTPFAGFDCVMNFVSEIFGLAASLALVATLAALFARPPRMLRRVLTWTAYAGAAALAAMCVVQGAGIWFGNSAILTPFTLRNAVAAAIAFVVLLCAALSLAASRGAERTKLAWIAGSLAVSVLAEMFVFLSELAPNAFVLPLFVIANVSGFITPVGLTYAVLNRRLLDVGFALNRAAVYTVVSIVIVGFFVLAEWALSEWLRDASHTTSLAVSAALALLLGLSVRAVHSRVDRILDTVFFRKRHEDERAIRTLAHEVAYITDAAAILQRTIATLERHADASFVTLALDDGHGHYGAIDENDPAIVALRAWRKTLDLHTVETQLAGDFSYPMIARGRLLGALVLGPKRSGDSYAPDESDAIAQLAHGVGGALDALSLHNDDLRDSLLDAIAALSDKISAGFERLAASENSGVQP